MKKGTNKRTFGQNLLMKWAIDYVMTTIVFIIFTIIAFSLLQKAIGVMLLIITLIRIKNIIGFILLVYSNDDND